MQDAESCVPHATTEESKSIRHISNENVHKICSGQVVLSLAVAVKELVENALDAGSTIIEVKLVNQGLESIEVCDNGSGVDEQNLDAMAAKYHTSKLKDFDDLRTVETFGFRGEALSSLCSLANMTIITRYKDQSIASRIVLDHNGRIIEKQQTARNVGTTVMLSHLFETIPVRRRDFVKNIKKEFSKMCQILQAYCLASKGVRIICSNQTPKGHKNIVMQTHGAKDVLDNISAVFGSKQISDLLKIKCPLRCDDGNFKSELILLKELQDGLNDSVEITCKDLAPFLTEQFSVEGYVSSCAHGSGRTSKDRQFMYINSRPCDLKHLSKTINDCYHRYNNGQVPFVYLNILTTRNLVDVNMTPDKRKLLITNEMLLLTIIKKALTATFNNIPSTYKMQNTVLSFLGATASKDEQPKKVPTSLEPLEHLPNIPTQQFCEVLAQWKRTGSTEGVDVSSMSKKRKLEDEINISTLKMKKVHEYLDQMPNPSKQSVCEKKSEDPDNIPSYSAPKNEQNTKIEIPTNMRINKMFSDSTTEDCSTHESSPNLSEKENGGNDFELDNHLEEQRKGKCMDFTISISDLKHAVTAEEHVRTTKAYPKNDRLRFKSEISPCQNKTAEAELQKEITKTDFLNMDVIGQFNLGFVIAKLGSDLFIVDQHATDEKYNFETLQKTTQLQHQPLAVAQVLELTAVNEMVLIDHIHVFEKNGFKFEIDAEGQPTRRVRLLGKPFSKNWEFGKEDIDELIFMLQDAPPGTMCRPSRITAMFASRACRMSVMIGKALKKTDMTTLIRHMGEIDQPWNCPHGRPTMRHLINIAMLHRFEENNAGQDAFS